MGPTLCSHDVAQPVVFFRGPGVRCRLLGAAFHTCAQDGARFDSQGVSAQVLDGKGCGAGDVVVPVSGRRYAVDEVEGHGLHPQVMGQTNGAFSLNASVGAVHPSQGLVVERLDPQTQPCDAKPQPSLDLGFGHVLWVGLQGDFAEIRRVLTHRLEHPGHQGFEQVGRQDGRGASAEVEGGEGLVFPARV